MAVSRGFGERMSGDGTVTSPQCHDCQNYYVGTLNCAAFPKGIPRDILSDKVDHKAPFDGDNGIRWIKKE